MHPARIIQTTGFRLAALYAGLFGVSVLVLLAVIYWIAGDALRQRLTETIESDVATISEDYATEGPGSAVEVIREQLASSLRPGAFYLLLDVDGKKIAGNLSTRAPEAGWHDFPAPRDPVEGAVDKREERHEHGVLALGVTMPDGAYLLVGEDTYRISEVEEAIIRSFGWVFGITILLGATGGIALSLGFLRRVDAINRTTHKIMEGTLTDRVPTRGTGDELDRLAGNLNRMLDRVQMLLESLREVSSDIAHDLRTPLSHLRQRLEGARLHANSVAEYEDAVDQAIADVDTILGTFSALLRIAQIEAGMRLGAFETVDLSRLFQTIAETYTAVAEDQARILDIRIEPGISVRGDRELLLQMLANLVENAICHSSRGAHIELVLEDGPGGPHGIVADNGPGIPVEARGKVFQRFFRLERSRATRGSGLGLSLVAAVADIHRITITLVDNKPGLKVLVDFAQKTASR